MSELDDLFDPDGEDAVVLRVHARPGAGRSQLVGRHGDALKVQVAAPPEQGRANAAIVAHLAEVLGLPARSVTLLSGERSRAKRVRITGIEPGGFGAALGRALELDGSGARRSRRRRA